MFIRSYAGNNEINVLPSSLKRFTEANSNTFTKPQEVDLVCDGADALFFSDSAKPTFFTSTREGTNDFFVTSIPGDFSLEANPPLDLITGTKFSFIPGLDIGEVEEPNHDGVTPQRSFNTTPAIQVTHVVRRENPSGRELIGEFSYNGGTNEDFRGFCFNTDLDILTATRNPELRSNRELLGFQDEGYKVATRTFLSNLALAHHIINGDTNIEVPTTDT